MTNTTNLDIEHLPAGANQPEVFVNEGLDKLDTAVAGLLTHAVATDGDYTLATGTSPPEWLYNVVQVTDTGGTLSTGRNIIVPAREKQYWLRNDTAQTLKIKTATGLGVPIATNKVAGVQCDGTNIFRLTADQTPQST